VNRLRNELDAPEAKLAEIEARGDSVTRLAQSVMLAEGALNGLLRAAEEKAIRKACNRAVRLGSSYAEDSARNFEGISSRHLGPVIAAVRDPTAQRKDQ
jgi:hypothetical protein